MNLVFEQLRVDGRINISKGIEDGIIIKNEEENEGARNKFWFNDYQYMFKEIYKDSFEDYAELISSEIAKELKINCANYDLAIFQNRYGVITENFVNENDGEELVSGTEIINEVYQKHILPLQEICHRYFLILNHSNLSTDLSNINELELSKKRELLKEVFELYLESKVKLNDMDILQYNDIKELSVEQIDNYLKRMHEIFVDLNGMYDKEFIKWKNGIIKANNLFDLWSVIDMYCKINDFNIKSISNIVKDLVNLFIYDIITSQGDRHSNNWGLIVNKNNMSIKLSPIYDNSNMCNLNRTKVMKTIHSYIEILESKGIQGAKKERLKGRLKKVIYHQKSSLKVIPEDVSDRNNNTTMITEFINVSSEEIKNEILEKINKLSPGCLDNIFTRIEQRIKTEIPKEIKDIVVKTIEININEFTQLLNKREGKQNGK